jgi:hypothetical protein
MHSRRHDVQLDHLAALQPAAGHGLLVQRTQADAIAQVGERHVAEGG